MREVLDEIAALEPPAPQRIRLSGVDCPVERMLFAESFRRALPGYAVVLNPANPVLHLLPRKEESAEGGAVEEAFEGRVLAVPQHTLAGRDLPFFIAVVVLAGVLHLPLPSLLLNAVALLAALGVTLRFLPHNLGWHVRGLGLGWPTPRLVLWVAACLPLLALPNHLLTGTTATRLLDGAMLLYIGHALWAWQASLMAAWFSADEGSPKVEKLPPITHFFAQLSLWLGLLFGGVAIVLWLYPPTAAGLGGALGVLDFLRLGGGVPLDAALHAAMAVLLLPPAAVLLIAGPALHAACFKRLTRLGILCESGGVLARLEPVRTLAMYKTGILTEARPKVSEVVACREGGEDDVLSLAAALGAVSEHIHAQAVYAHAQRKRLDISEAEDAAEWPGLGVSAMLGGRRMFLGSGRFMAALGVDTEALHHALYRLGRSGESVLVVADAQKALGLVALRDGLRGGSVRANKTLAELGVSTVLLSRGDRGVAETVAAQCALSTSFAENTEDELAAQLRRYANDKLGGCALLSLREPEPKLRACAEVVVGLNTAGDAIGAVRADMEVRRGVEDIAEVMQLLGEAKRKRHQAVFAALLAALLAGVGAILGVVPAVLAPFVPGALLYYVQWSAPQVGASGDTRGEAGSGHEN